MRPASAAVPAPVPRRPPTSNTSPPFDSTIVTKPVVRQLSPSATGDVAAVPPGGDRLAARQRRARRRGDLGHRLQQHLEIDQHRAAARRDHVLHVEIAAAQHVGEADEAAGEREVGADLGQAGAGLLLHELDPPVVAAIEDPQGQAGKAAA